MAKIRLSYGLLIVSAITIMIFFVFPSSLTFVSAFLPGTDFPIGQGPGAQFVASATYDKQTDQYMVVFQNNATGIFRSVGQLINSTGEPVGSQIKISPLAGSQLRPVVSYNSKNNSYFVVFLDQNAKVTTHQIVYGQIISSMGKLGGSSIRVSDPVGDAEEHWAVYNKVDNQYLVAWRDQRNNQTTGFDVYGQIVNANGTLFGTNFAISTAPKDQLFQHIAYDPKDDVYLVVWIDKRNQTITSTDIYGQLVSHTGSLIGKEIKITAANGNQDRPVNSYSIKSNSFFVTWVDNRNSSTLGTDIYGAVVSNTGKVIKTDIPISNKTGNQGRPEIDYNLVDNQYLIAWSDDRNLASTGYDMYGQKIDPNGNAIGNEILISNATGDQIKPEPSFNSKHDQYLVAMSDTRNGNYDIFGNIVP